LFNQPIFHVPHQLSMAQRYPQETNRECFTDWMPFMILKQTSNHRKHDCVYQYENSYNI